METLLGKKGQQQMNISSIGSIAIAILVAVVILGLGATILQKIQATQKDTSVTVGDNDSFAWPGNNTEVGFSQSRVNAGSVVLYCNATILTSGNFSATSSGISIINTTLGDLGLELDLCNFNISFSHLIGSEARNATGFGIDGVVDMAEFVPTISLIAVAAIVIGIVLVMFGRRKLNV